MIRSLPAYRVSDATGDGAIGGAMTGGSAITIHGTVAEGSGSNHCCCSSDRDGWRGEQKHVVAV